MIKENVSRIIKENNLSQKDHIVLNRLDYIKLATELGIKCKVDGLIIKSHHIKLGKVQIADKKGIRTLSLYGE